MKVLMICRIFPPRYGGGVIQAIFLAKELKRQGIDVEFATNNYRQKTALDIYDGFSVYKFCSYFESKALSSLGQFIYFLKMFLFLLFKSNHDIILFFGISGFDTFLFPLTKLFGKKTLLQLTLVGCDDPLSIRKRKLGFLFHPSLYCVDKIIPISTKLFHLSLESGISKKKLELIPVGVNTSMFFKLPTEDKKVLKSKLGFLNYSHIFLAVGQIEERKGYEFMIQAWKFIGEKLPNSVLLIAGPKNDVSNPYFQKLLTIIKESSLKNILFLGFIHNINEYMKITDCLLHCSTAEGLPNTLIEAGISSVPIVCRHIDGVTSDIIITSNIGRQCFSDLPADFAKEVFSILKERNELNTALNIEELKKRFDIKEVARQYINLFNWLKT
ncbi:MAG: glycosyltransferase [Candidatus Jettenia sp.]|uniref:Putative glycosyltransferase n=1 Tax=Candidatus Jettenia caeni TaxID=247490 RepID=I3IGH5_9BACT|nr:glycosyltransferase family 4 protein [Candidatus Jettenia sp. AMX1]MBC6929781.1 glycosyltransferase [Candidatus Jettenia sp.]NUN23672.1 glycosyltransferase family 4 protein [Candidatus Jettenia caeni]KAA0248791.1 MAG: glycosyltransferase [Candidatus Jettenia sp. AMX1]MCE7881403.1 glycosyltransferase [Candidatus Jettenia sp. AMX1]MCQ3927984.1 glycosyltransferase [Candidatus Jettenia sp.]